MAKSLAQEGSQSRSTTPDDKGSQPPQAHAHVEPAKKPRILRCATAAQILGHPFIPAAAK